MDPSKLKKMEDVVRIGGKGSVRRKHKHVQSSPALGEKRLQATLAKLPLQEVPGIQEITLEMNDSSEILLMSPKVQGSVASNVFVLSGDLAHSNPPVSKPPASAQHLARSSQKPPAQVANQVAKKPKKPRNRIRCRNKRAQNMLAQAEEAGKNEAEKAKQEQDPQAGGDSPANDADDEVIEEVVEVIEVIEEVVEVIEEVDEDEEYFSEVGSNLSTDSDKTKVPSDGSDMDQTIVGDDDSLGSWDAPTSGHTSDPNQADNEFEDWADDLSDDDYPAEVPRPGTPRGPFSDDEFDSHTPMNLYTESSDEEDTIQV
ncbi:uncharacterized protein LOC108025637 [Drosophila biarmipes]|uniref:uncharacterized protein LOC108025637 n=1 Tax=Drosophila biarmipes TaxID=125945 RepID=UPI0007E69594|nr:uncharacterized protein LOC108025637 [Drosophila biarmipes]XP_050743212.1 uncharacterized protein LOC108025637 [Drosophila biarmipes]